MTAFQFRLERVLHWRAIELAAEEAKLKRMMEEEARLAAALAEIRKTISEIPTRLSELQALSGSDFNRTAGYAIRLSNECTRLQDRRRAQQRMIAEQMEVHRKAKQRHRLLEELRSRRHNEWKMETLRQLDEIAHESYLARWSAD